MSLTRPQFERACKLVLEGDDSCSSWSWRSHQTFQHLGYLERRVSMLVKSPGNTPDETREIPADEEESTAVNPSPDFVSWDQYIVYSPSFMVPAFYFIVWDQQGVQLTLDKLLQIGIFRFDPSAKFDKTTFGLSEPGSAFPLLSRGDHPVLGTLCWYFHPCESSVAVDELVNEVIATDASEEDRLRCWMNKWFLVLRSVVNL